MRIVPFLLLPGCLFGAPDEIPDEDFAYWGARVLCDRTQECARGDFEALYFSMGDCRASLEVALQAQYDLFDDLDCDYRPKRAGEAYQAILDMDCEDFYEGEWVEESNEIWDDCIPYYGPYPGPYTYGTYQ